MENNFMIDNFVIGIQRCRKLQFFFILLPSYQFTNLIYI